jgi:hypothetical protein
VHLESAPNQIYARIIAISGPARRGAETKFRDGYRTELTKIETPPVIEEPFGTDLAVLIYDEARTFEHA